MKIYKRILFTSALFSFLSLSAFSFSSSKNSLESKETVSEAGGQIESQESNEITSESSRQNPGKDFSSQDKKEGTAIPKDTLSNSKGILGLLQVHSINQGPDKSSFLITLNENPTSRNMVTYELSGDPKTLSEIKKLDGKMVFVKGKITEEKSFWSKKMTVESFEKAE